MSTSLALLSAIYAVTTPGAHDLGLKIAECLIWLDMETPFRDELDTALHSWVLPATSISIAANHSTPLRTQREQARMSYSLICTLGDYRLSKFEVPSLGFQGLDEPGTVMVGLGGLLPHGMSHAQGDRVTLSTFMSTSIIKKIAYLFKESDNPILQYDRSSPIRVSSFDTMFFCRSR